MNDVIKWITNHSETIPNKDKILESGILADPKSLKKVTEMSLRKKFIQVCCLVQSNLLKKELKTEWSKYTNGVSKSIYEIVNDKDNYMEL